MIPTRVLNLDIGLWLILRCRGLNLDGSVHCGWDPVLFKPIGRGEDGIPIGPGLIKPKADCPTGSNVGRKRLRLVPIRCNLDALPG